MIHGRYIVKTNGYRSPVVHLFGGEHIGRKRVYFFALCGKVLRFGTGWERRDTDHHLTICQDCLIQEAKP